MAACAGLRADPRHVGVAHEATLGGRVAQHDRLLGSRNILGDGRGEVGAGLGGPRMPDGTASPSAVIDASICRRSSRTRTKNPRCAPAFSTSVRIRRSISASSWSSPAMACIADRGREVEPRRHGSSGAGGGGDGPPGLPAQRRGLCHVAFTLRRERLRIALQKLVHLGRRAPLEVRMVSVEQVRAANPRAPSVEVEARADLARQRLVLDVAVLFRELDGPVDLIDRRVVRPGERRELGGDEGVPVRVVRRRRVPPTRGESSRLHAARP